MTDGEFRAETEFILAKRKRNAASCPATVQALGLVETALRAPGQPDEVYGRLLGVQDELTGMLDNKQNVSERSLLALIAYIAQEGVPGVSSGAKQ